MTAFFASPRAIFGAPLLGKRLVRNIYVDESGTSPREDWRVVIGLIVNPDKQWWPAATMLHGLMASAPEQYRSAVFHTTEMLDGKKFPGWAIEDRRRIVHEVMAIPKRLRIPIAIGAGRKGTPVQMFNYTEPDQTAREHMATFCMAIGAADEFIRTADPNEMAQVIAENTQSMRDFLQVMLNYARLHPFVVYHPPPGQNWQCSVQNVIDEIHFMDKSRAAPLLQIADACAYGIRRYFEGRSFGEQCLESVTTKGFALPKSEPIFHTVVVPMTRPKTAADPNASSSQPSAEQPS